MFWFRRKEARAALCAQLEETRAELQQAKQEHEKILRERELDNEACRRAFTTHSSELTRAKADAEEQKLASQSLLADKAKLQAELIDHLKLLRLRDERLGILRRDLADSEFELDQLRVALRCTTEYSLHLEADNQAAEAVILQICAELDRLAAAAAAAVSDAAANALGDPAALSDSTTIISGKDSEPARSPQCSGGVLGQPGGGRRSGSGAGVGAKGSDGRTAGSGGAGSWGADRAGGGSGGVRCAIGETVDGGGLFCGVVTTESASLEGHADGAAEGPRCRALRSGDAVGDNVDGAAAAATAQRAAAAAADGALKLYGVAAHLPTRLSSVRQQLHALIVDPAAAAAAAAVAASAPKAAAAPDLAAADAGTEVAAPPASDSAEGRCISTRSGDSGGGGGRGRGGGSPPCPPATPQPAAAAAALLQLCVAKPRRTGSEAPTEYDAAVGGLRDWGHRRHAITASAEPAALAGLLLGSRGRCGGGGGGSGGPPTAGAAAQAAGAGAGVGLSPWGSPPASVPLTPPARPPALAGLSEALQGWGAHGGGGGGVRGAMVVQGRRMGAASPPSAPSLLSSPTRCNGSYLPHPPAPSPMAAAPPPPPSPAFIAVGQGSPHQRQPAPDQHHHHHAASNPPSSRELDSELVSLRLTNEALQRQVAELQRQNDLLQLRQLGGGGGASHQQLLPEPPHPLHHQHHHLHSHSGQAPQHSSPSGVASGPWGSTRGATGPRQQQHAAAAAAAASAAAANPYSSPFAAPYYYGSLPPGRQPAFGVAAAGGEPPLLHPALGRTVVVSGGGGSGPTTHLAGEFGHPRGTQTAGPAAPGSGSRRDASPGASARAGATVAAPEDSAGISTDRAVAGGDQGRRCCQGAAGTDGGTQLAPAVPPPPTTTTTAIGPAAAAAVTAGPTHGLAVGPDVYGKGSPADPEALTPSPPAAAAAVAADAALAVAAPPGGLAAKVPPPPGVDPALWELDLLVACSKGGGL